MGDAISSLLFQPPPPTYLHPSRHFWLNTTMGSRIPAFFIEKPNAQVTILFSHGNAEDLGMIYDWFNDLARVLRVNIMGYDYTGYGKSNGVPNEDNCYADIEAAYKYLLEVRRIKPEQIVLYGRSLGSGPSCYLASKTAKDGRSVGGVILQSPLLSAYRVAFNFRYTMLGDRFPNINYAPHIRCPVFIIHGTQDEVVPFWHGQDLFLALKQPWRAKPFWVEGAGHNNIEALLRTTGAFVDKLNEFLELHVSARRLKVSSPPVPVPECVPAALRDIEARRTNQNHSAQQKQQQQKQYSKHHSSLSSSISKLNTKTTTAAAANTSTTTKKSKTTTTTMVATKSKTSSSSSSSSSTTNQPKTPSSLSVSSPPMEDTL